jgi:hypothetical protein
MERNMPSGAFGNDPRIAWLPITTSSLSPLTSAAATITWSNSARRI